jgi:hypothetical protein
MSVDEEEITSIDAYYKSKPEACSAAKNSSEVNLVQSDISTIWPLLSALCIASISPAIEEMVENGLGSCAGGLLPG